MKIFQQLVFLLFSLLFSANLLADDDAITKIKRQSQLLAKTIKEEDSKTLLQLFNVDATLLPEYHNNLNGKTLIKSYYEAFFSKTNTLNYIKESFEIQAIGKYYIELGTFEHPYMTPDKERFDYNGKFTTYWSISSNGTPKIVAHIWGASSYFEAKNVNFVNLEVEGGKALMPNTELEEKIEAHRMFVYDAVLNGDAKKQMTTYADDAIYMTYYDPPFIGKDNISGYFTAHYNPDARMGKLVTKAVKVVDLGDYALKFGEYYVGWIDKGKRYFIKGKGLTLYENSKNQPLMIYRQMINHSMPPTLVSEDDRMRVEKILQHLDNQELALDDYLSVYTSDELEIMPPNQFIIKGRQNFKSFLAKERQNGKTTIVHKVDDIQSFDDIVIVSGRSSGEYHPSGETASYPFQTQNLMLLKRMENGALKISKLIWHMTPPN